jgi:hypothetical protein
MRTAMMKLMEVVYHRLPDSLLNAINSALTPKFEIFIIILIDVFLTMSFEKKIRNAKGNELIQMVMRTCHSIKSQPPPPYNDEITGMES